LAIAATLKEFAPELARLDTMDHGSPLRLAMGITMGGTKQLEWAGQAARALMGEYIPATQAKTAFWLKREPIGVCSLIIPWNGPLFPDRIDMMSPYAQAFGYADLKRNGAKYYNPQAINKGEDIIGNYHQAVVRGEKLLPFTIYVPCGYGSYNNQRIPNVEETDKPELIFTASFPENETWRDLRISDYPWIQTVSAEAITLT
jgi:hypothetical protein